MWWFKKYTINDLSVLSYEEIKRITRIVVVDDDPNSFPYDLLKKEGYAIDYWPDIQDLSKLDEGRYNIIFLDIQGIGKEYTEDEGIGILEHIKTFNPSQIVVAFSGHNFDLSKTKFWRMADDSLCKPVQAAKCKQIIDNLIKTKLTPFHYWSSLAGLLKANGYSDQQIQKLEGKLSKALIQKKPFQEIVNSTVDNADMALRVINIVKKIILLLG